MTTSKKRVAAYLDPSIEEAFRKYQAEAGMNDSEAINAILGEFLGVSKTLKISTLRKNIREEIDSYLGVRSA